MTVLPSAVSAMTAAGGPCSVPSGRTSDSGSAEPSGPSSTHGRIPPPTSCSQCPQYHGWLRGSAQHCFPAYPLYCGLPSVACCMCSAAAPVIHVPARCGQHILSIPRTCLPFMQSDLRRRAQGSMAQPLTPWVSGWACAGMGCENAQTCALGSPERREATVGERGERREIASSEQRAETESR